MQTIRNRSTQKKNGAIALHRSKTLFRHRLSAAQRVFRAAQAGERRIQPQKGMSAHTVSPKLLIEQNYSFVQFRVGEPWDKSGFGGLPADCLSRRCAADQYLQYAMTANVQCVRKRSFLNGVHFNQNSLSMSSVVVDVSAATFLCAESRCSSYHDSPVQQNLSIEENVREHFS